MRIIQSVALLAALSVPAAAFADTITVTGTGVNVGVGNPDPNYTVSGPGLPLQQAITINPNPGWGAQPAFNPAAGAVNWDNPGGDGSTVYPGGLYTYTTTFTVPANFYHPTLSGSMAADNAVSVYLNGTLYGTAPYGPPYGFSQLTPFTITGSFIPGVNTLTFVVQNGNFGSDQAGPTGLLAPNLTATYSAVPEPSSIALLGTGILGLAGVARKKLLKA